MKVKKIIKIIILIIITILIFCFIMKNFFPAEWSFITPHKQGDFVRVGNMHFETFIGEPILLDDGRVALFGANKSEFYNPKTRRFKVIKNQLPFDWQIKIQNDTKTNNKKLVEIDNSIEINPQSVAIKLSDGKILFTEPGKYSKSNYSIFFDPKTNRFIKGPGLITGRWRHTAILLNDGRVFIAGGELDNWEKQKIKQDKYSRLKTTEFYNPKTNKFEQGPTLPEALANLKMLLVEGGNVIMIGGYNEKFKSNLNIYLFNSATNVISKIGELKVKRRNQDIFILSTGNIVILQGLYEDTNGNAVEIEEFNSKTGQTEIINKIPKNRKKPPLVLVYKAIALPNDIILIGGNVASDFYSPSRYYFIDKYYADTNTYQYSYLETKTEHIYNGESILLRDGNLLLLNAYPKYIYQFLYTPVNRVSVIYKIKK